MLSRPTDILAHVHSMYAYCWGSITPGDPLLRPRPVSIQAEVGAMKAYSGAYTSWYRCMDTDAVDCESRGTIMRGLVSKGSAPGWLSRSGRQVDSANGRARGIGGRSFCSWMAAFCRRALSAHWLIDRGIRSIALRYDGSRLCPLFRYNEGRPYPTSLIHPIVRLSSLRLVVNARHYLPAKTRVRLTMSPSESRILWVM